MGENLLDLLPEIREKIFSFCTHKDLFNLARCNTDYFNAVMYIIYKHVTIKWLCLRENVKLTTKQLSYINLTVSLSFKRNPRVLRALESNLDWEDIGDNFNNVLNNCNVNRLKSLNLADCFSNINTNEKFISISRLVWLRKLVLSNCSLSDDELHYLLPLSLLESLDLSYTGITNNGLLHIAKLTSLVRLFLIDCWMLEGDGYKHLRTLNRLSSLNVSWNNISDIGLSHLSMLSSLKELNLKSCTAISNNGYDCLKNLRNIISLDVSHVTILTDEGLNHIGKIAYLKTLQLSYCRSITFYGFQVLSYLKSLQYLHLKSVNLTDEAMFYIGKLESLVELDLSFNRITDEGVLQLNSAMGLRVLDLSHCILLTDISLEYVLSTFSLLRWFAIKGCRKINMTGKSRIKLVSMQDLQVDL